MFCISYLSVQVPSESNEDAGAKEEVDTPRTGDTVSNVCTVFISCINGITCII
jgi:hypothetical protein